MLRTSSGIRFSGLLLTGITVFAAEPAGPQTLVNLLQAADTEPQATVVAEEAPNNAEEPSAAYNNDLLQQRLDAALAEYNSAIEKAIDELTKAIRDEFNKATRKGDIKLARKCKEVETALRERGVLPAGDFLNSAREKAQRQITRAAAKLSAEFEDVAKQYLKADDLESAESVLSEKAKLLAGMKNTRLKRDPKPQDKMVGQWVQSLDPAEVKRRYWKVINTGQPDALALNVYGSGEHKAFVSRYVPQTGQLWDLREPGVLSNKFLGKDKILSVDTAGTVYMGMRQPRLSLFRTLPSQDGKSFKIRSDEGFLSVGEPSESQTPRVFLSATDLGDRSNWVFLPTDRFFAP